jgi:SAM-dependent methyltransferase
MRKFESRSKNLAYLAYRWMKPVWDPVRFIRAVPGYAWFFRDWLRYRAREGAERIKIIDSYPLLEDRTTTSTFDSHYFYQDRWAFGKILRSGVAEHVDVGSRLDLIGFLTVICRVTFVDIRPLVASVENLESRAGSILSLPYTDGAVKSLSCLHVAEHIGLGRYGDPLDPLGTVKACDELARVLAPGGNLYFSLPVGKPRLCFNAHRVHAPGQIREYFSTLDLVEFSGIDDEGRFLRDIKPATLEDANYACGLFHWRKL